MKYCFHYHSYREGEKSSLGFAALFSFFSLEGIYMLLTAQSVGRAIAGLLLIALGLGFTWFFLISYFETCRKYAISEEGITLSYPFEYTVFHSWSEISEIGICNVHYNHRSPVTHMVAIRIVMGKEKKGPSQGYDVWADSYYSAIHFRTIITVLYSDERLEEFEDVCPLEIIDYRRIKRY